MVSPALRALYNYFFGNIFMNKDNEAWEAFHEKFRVITILGKTDQEVADILLKRNGDNGP